MNGPLIILSGPSGSGKSTVVERLLRTPGLKLRLAVSATTRQRRPAEVDGKHYHFWTRDRFEEAIAAGAFLEKADVFGHSYGTLRQEVEPFRTQGWGVILEIDVQGAAQVRQQVPDAVSIFLRAPSPEAYEQRLRARRTEDEATIRRRVARAAAEEAQAATYDYQVINDDLDRAVAEITAIIRGQFAKGDDDVR